MLLDPSAPADALDLFDVEVTRAEGDAVAGDLFPAGFVGEHVRKGGHGESWPLH